MITKNENKHKNYWSIIALVTPTNFLFNVQNYSQMTILNKYL